jgi:putative endonuclease
MYYVYFITSLKNNKTYVGFTSKNPRIRLEEHNNGSNVFTSANRPFQLIYYETYICKQDAIQREKFYKSGIGKKIKKAIIDVMKN